MVPAVELALAGVDEAIVERRAGQELDSSRAGSIARSHLPFYLNEFVFRFNRRTSRSRGLVFFRVLELAVDHDPVRYRQLLTHRPHTKRSPTPPGPVRSGTSSLELPAAGKP